MTQLSKLVYPAVCNTVFSHSRENSCKPQQKEENYFCTNARPEDIILKATFKKSSQINNVGIYLDFFFLFSLLSKRNQWKCFISYFISSGLTHFSSFQSHLHSNVALYYLFRTQFAASFWAFIPFAKLTMFCLRNKWSFVVLLRHLKEFKYFTRFAKLSEQTLNKLIHTCVSR